jgi:hypothetical protein
MTTEKESWQAKIKNAVQDWTESGEQVRCLTFQLEEIFNAELDAKDARIAELEKSPLKEELEVYAERASKFGDLSCCYDAEDVMNVVDRFVEDLTEERESLRTRCTRLEARLGEAVRVIRSVNQDYVHAGKSEFIITTWAMGKVREFLSRPADSLGQDIDLSYCRHRLGLRVRIDLHGRNFLRRRRNRTSSDSDPSLAL